MGFYCSTTIVDKNKKHLFTINTEKYGIGYGKICFEKEDYTLNVPNHVLFAMTPVKKAQERVQKYYDEITAKRDQKIQEGMEYDEWSNRAVQKFLDFAEKLLKVFQSYKSEYVYADFKEASYLYKANHEFPVSCTSELRFIHHVLDGCYLGMHPSDVTREKTEAFIESLKEKLLQVDGILGIENFGSSYDPQFFRVGNQTLVKFQMDIQFSHESIEKDYFVADSVLIPIRPHLLEVGCDFEKNYSADYINKEGKERIIFYKTI